MYFASRQQAGRMLADRMFKKYGGQKCAVLALSDGGVMVGAQIALKLHCVVTLLVSEEIMLPREPDALAGITQSGAMAYNQRYSQGEINELLGDYYSVVEQEKLVKMHDMNHMLGSKGTVERRLLQHHNVIVVADGLKSGFPVDLAAEFLKPVSIKKLIVATPFASVKAVDRMHVLADDLYCLNVVEDYLDTDHYYEKKDIPDHQTVIKTVGELIKKWQ